MNLTQVLASGFSTSWHFLEKSENARQTIESLCKYENRVELLYSTDSIVPKHYYADVYSKLKSKIPIHLELNVHNIDEKQIKLLSEAGVKVTEAGIESISTQSLRLMKKVTTATKNLKFMMDCLMNDIYVIVTAVGISLAGKRLRAGKYYRKSHGDCR